MDQFGQLPLTLAMLDVRLRRGEVLVIERGPDALDFRLSFDGKGHYILRQGGQDQPFHQLEVAVLTLLCCQGEFTRGS